MPATLCVVGCFLSLISDSHIFVEICRFQGVWVAFITLAVLSVTFKKKTLLLSFRTPCHTSVWKTCCTALLIRLDVVQTSLRRSQSLLCSKGCDTCWVCSGGIGLWICLCWRSIQTPKKIWVWICSDSSLLWKDACDLYM